MAKSVCLDTRILSMYLKGKKSARSLLNKLKDEGFELYTTTINISEYFMGYYKSNLMTDEKLAILNEFFQALFPKSLDYKTAQIAGKLYSTTLKSNSIGWRDTFIASIVLNNGNSIITSNIKHFERVPKLKIIEYI